MVSGVHIKCRVPTILSELLLAGPRTPFLLAQAHPWVDRSRYLDVENMDQRRPVWAPSHLVYKLINLLHLRLPMGRCGQIGMSKSNS